MNKLSTPKVEKQIDPRDKYLSAGARDPRTMSDVEILGGSDGNITPAQAAQLEIEAKEKGGWNFNYDFANADLSGVDPLGINTSINSGYSMLENFSNELARDRLWNVDFSYTDNNYYEYTKDGLDILDTIHDIGRNTGFKTTTVTSELDYRRYTDWTSSDSVTKWEALFSFDNPLVRVEQSSNTQILSEQIYRTGNVETGYSRQTRITEVDGLRNIDMFSADSQKWLGRAGKAFSFLDYAEPIVGFATSNKSMNVRSATAAVDLIQVGVSGTLSGIAGVFTGTATTLGLAAVGVPTTAGVGSVTVAPAVGFAAGVSTSLAIDNSLDDLWNANGQSSWLRDQSIRGATYIYDGVTTLKNKLSW